MHKTNATKNVSWTCINHVDYLWQSQECESSKLRKCLPLYMDIHNMAMLKRGITL